ncbi:hypothetical protein SCB71_19010 [Herbiconiux sp. KACC 21604]|uniref:hypothetical protein n=1 Tax=unclassified Herbiconiux TaxID=2618217 RepID=UPI001492DEB8|nr:hypothetical protein [Herbiconiux sp. SALV-R1]QJU55136.1 hypothetical protein HL652_16950 [Herbiconiux sp. SALV-R1]WPO86288.1 hypothetical protein SCB71_19010 [Herbiconiux sp. KACC 21604]
MDDATLLGILLRVRPATIDEAVSATHLDVAHVAQAVHRLRDQGLIAGAGERLAYPPPADWANDAVSVHTRRVRVAAEDAMSGIERILENLPSMLRAWSVGETSTDLVPTVLRHGPFAAEDLWWELVPKPSGTLVAVFTEIDRLMDASSERAVRFGKALAEQDSVRIIVPSAATADPAVRERMAQYGPHGLEYRSLERAPGWFWVDGDHIAMPFIWGETTPTGVLGVQHAGLANIVRAYFDELWRRAEPIGAEQQPWTSLLRLMQQGNTLESASKQLGINPRTGRRRISAAMEHYGAPTLFAVGAAWTAAGAGTPPAAEA